MPDIGFVTAAERVLGNTGALRKAHEFLVRRPGLAAWFREWAHQEKEAITLFTYEPRMVPGLMQTEAYARQLFIDELPPLTDEQIEDNWTAREERQKLLHTRPNTAFSFIVEEGVFLRRTGGAEVTHAVIEHLLEMGQLRNVEVQIMPQVQESHAGLHGPIRLLETPENKWLGYSEGQESGQLISDPKAISVLQIRYARMRSQALTIRDSVSLLQRMRGDL